MSGNHSRRKGADGEREFANILKTSLAPEMEESTIAFYVEREGMKQQGTAKNHTFDILIPKIGIEVKRKRVVLDGDVKAWWQETVEQSAASGKLGVLAYRADQQIWRIMVPGHHIDEEGRLQLHSFLELTETLYLPGFFRWYITYVAMSSQPKVEKEAANG